MTVLVVRLLDDAGNEVETRTFPMLQQENPWGGDLDIEDRDAVALRSYVDEFVRAQAGDGIAGSVVFTVGGAPAL